MNGTAAAPVLTGFGCSFFCSNGLSPSLSSKSTSDDELFGGLTTADVFGGPETEGEDLGPTLSPFETLSYIENTC